MMAIRVSRIFWSGVRFGWSSFFPGRVKQVHAVERSSARSSIISGGVKWVWGERLGCGYRPTGSKATDVGHPSVVFMVALFEMVEG